jgi:hypothetical protein
MIRSGVRNGRKRNRYKKAVVENFIVLEPLNIRQRLVQENL